MSKVHTGPRKVMASSSTAPLTETGLTFESVLPSEIDNHADTHCFGSNFIPFSWTQLECEVSPFLDTYAPVENVPICAGATAVTLDSGETLVLIFGQGLWFGNRMNKSLINPNQCRAYNVPVCDDPTDPYRPLGIELEDHHIPFIMQGSTAIFHSRRPTPEEMDTCEHIYMSDTEFWDPHNVQFQVSSVNVPNEGGICSEYDVALGQISESFNPYAFVPKVIESVIIAKVKTRVDTNPIEPSMKPRIEDLGSSHFTSDRHNRISPEYIAKKWGCGLRTARNTLQGTTQLGVRSAIGPLTRRYRTDLLQLRYRRLNARFYTDTMFAKTKSIQQNTCAQIYTDGKGYVRADPMRSKAEAGMTLSRLMEDVGIPNEIVSDGAPEVIGKGTEFGKLSRQFSIKRHQTEPETQRHNRAEDSIRELKRRWKQRVIKRRVPKKVWDFAIVWESEILSRLCRHGTTISGIERITGDTPDISEWIEFEFYDLCWYWDVPNTDDNPRIGRWLGVSHRVGTAMSYWILTAQGTVVSRTTVQHITKEEIANPDIMEEVRQYHVHLDTKLGDDNYVYTDGEFNSFVNEDVPDEMEGNTYPPRFQETFEEPYQGYELPHVDEVGKLEDELAAADTFDRYLGVEVVLPSKRGEPQMAKVVKRIKTSTGDPSKPYNPMMDTSNYLVEFPDGDMKEVPANLIAECMFSQVDSEGHHFQLLSEIIDHRVSEEAIKRDDGFIKAKNGNMIPKTTTRGWDLLVEWKDGSHAWIPLKDLKISHPIELAEYAVANDIEDEPAFKWWVSHTLKKRNAIISKVKSKYWRTTHKFGIRVPKNVDEALRIDEEEGNTYWYDAIQKEMGNVIVAFTPKDDLTVEEARSGKSLVGYQEVRCHMIFDIKMDGKFTRKARFVAGGHTTDPPSSITYSSVVSRDSVRICFTIAALNGLDCMSCDIGNAYLNAPCREKIWTVAGTEFGSNKGKVMVITRALYGLKTSGASWRAMFAETLRDKGYFPTRADPDVWLKPKVKPNGDEYYSMILVYVDDCLHFDHEPNTLMDYLESIYRLKDKAEAPDRYLGANMDKVQLEDGRVLWSMASYDYVKSSIANLEKTLEKEGSRPLRTYGKRAGERPFPVDYRPEVDVSPELGDELGNRYLQLIGILRWAIELGRIDITTHVSMLSQYQCSPREGHLDAVYRIFWFLKCKLKDGIKGRIVFDGTEPFIDERLFNPTGKDIWKDFYPEAKEEIPPNTPTPRGRRVCTSCYVDADHAGNMMTRRSHTGILIYVMNTPIIWYSKRQNTVESASFGSEFIALRIATEMVRSLRYKLRMFGVPLDEATNVFCDNKSVVTNSTIPASMINKKHNAICYHMVREAQASGMIRVGWIQGEYNKADLLTKTTLGTSRIYDLTNTIFSNKVESIGKLDG